MQEATKPREAARTYVFPVELMPEVGRDLFVRLAKAAGLPEWDFRPVYGDSEMNAIAREQVAFRRALVEHSARGEADWNAIDLVLATENARRAGRKAA